LCGRLGDNSAVNKSSPVREISSSTTWCQVDGGGSHSSGIKTDGTLWSWGYNGQGQLGDNTSTSRSSPVREISSTATWQQVSGGSNHTAATSTGYCTTL
jgi:alpha-tubulin suppressor-like RCC1 family protein